MTITQQAGYASVYVWDGPRWVAAFASEADARAFINSSPAREREMNVYAPWTRDRNEGREIIRDSRGFQICSVLHFTQDGHEAIVNLILAAPALLAALIALREYQAIDAQADAAIAKAKGAGS